MTRSILNLMGDVGLFRNIIGLEWVDALSNHIYRRILKGNGGVESHWGLKKVADEV
jgi:hypothetical protein